MIANILMEDDDDKSTSTPASVGQPLGEHGLEAEDQDFRPTKEDIEVHPSV